MLPGRGGEGARRRSAAEARQEAGTPQERRRRRRGGAAPGGAGRRGPRRGGQEALLLAAPDLRDLLRASYGAADAEDRSAALFALVRTVDLLILDDLGTEQASPWAVEKLFQVVNERVECCLPLVVTSNQAPHQVEPRIRSRLFRQLFQGQVFALAAPDSMERRAGRGWVDPHAAHPADGAAPPPDPWDRGQGER